MPKTLSFEVKLQKQSSSKSTFIEVDLYKFTVALMAKYAPTLTVVVICFLRWCLLLDGFKMFARASVHF
jgi:hypothetical protein